jgi:hypothetical protein
MNSNNGFDNRLNTGNGPGGGMMGNMPPGDFNKGRGPFNQGPMQQRDGGGNAGPGNMRMTPKKTNPNFMKENMEAGGGMQGNMGNMGPGGMNMNSGNFGNMNPRNFGGMNNMPFSGPDQRDMFPKQGPGPMNNPPRFQGNQG